MPTGSKKTKKTAAPADQHVKGTRHHPELIRAAVAHLTASDPVLATLISRVGEFHLELQPDAFQMLLRSVVGQQLSTRVARTIWTRVQAAGGPGKLTASKVLALGYDGIRACGLSQAKALCLLDLATRVQTRELRPARFQQMPDYEIDAVLTPVRGIGPWTIQMLLIFGLGRPDVLPEADLGIRVAIRNLYGLPDLPDRTTVQRIGRPWRPYASIASLYLWRSLDALPAERQT